MMSCYNPENPPEPRQMIGEDCPLDELESIITRQIDSEDPKLRANALSAKQAITEGRSVCGGPTVTSRMGESGISATKICNNPNKLITLTLLDLSDSLRNPR